MLVSTPARPCLSVAGSHTTLTPKVAGCWMTTSQPLRVTWPSVGPRHAPSRSLRRRSLLRRRVCARPLRQVTPRMHAEESGLPTTATWCRRWSPRALRNVSSLQLRSFTAASAPVVIMSNSTSQHRVCAQGDARCRRDATSSRTGWTPIGACCMDPGLLGFQLERAPSVTSACLAESRPRSNNILTLSAGPRQALRWQTGGSSVFARNQGDVLLKKRREREHSATRPALRNSRCWRACRRRHMFRQAATNICPASSRRLKWRGGHAYSTWTKKQRININPLWTGSAT